MSALIPADKKKRKLLLIRSAQRRRNGFWEKENPVSILKEAANGTPFSAELEAVIATLEKLLAGLQAPRTRGIRICVPDDKRSVRISCHLRRICRSDAFQPCGQNSRVARGTGPGGIARRCFPKIHGNRRQLGESLRRFARLPDE